MKHGSVVLFTMLLLVGCSRQTEALPRVDISQLNSLEQADLKKELLGEMREKAKVRMTESAQRTLKLLSQNPFPICHHNRFEIKFNFQGDLFVRGTPTSYSNLSEEIFKYYNMNRSLRQGEIGTTASTPNYKYPLYSRMSRAEIVNALKREYEMRKGAKNAKNEALVELHDLAIRDWKEKLRVIDILRIQEIKEVRHIPIEIINEYDSIGFSRAAESVLVGIYKIRNAVALEYFGESYLSIYLRHKALKTKRSANQLMAIEYLYPLMISDHPYLTSIHVIIEPTSYSIYAPPYVGPTPQKK